MKINALNFKGSMYIESHSVPQNVRENLKEHIEDSYFGPDTKYKTAIATSNEDDDEFTSAIDSVFKENLDVGEFENLKGMIQIDLIAGYEKARSKIYTAIENILKKHNLSAIDVPEETCAYIYKNDKKYGFVSAEEECNSPVIPGMFIELEVE